MKKNREILAEAVGMINDRFVTEAAECAPPSGIKLRGLHAGLIAACLIAAAAVSVIVIRSVRVGKAGQEQSGNVSVVQTQSGDVSAVQTGIAYPRPYTDQNFINFVSRQATTEETAPIWPWEYKTIYEKYPNAEFGGAEYSLFSKEVLGNVPIAGETLGSCTLKGYDDYTDKEYTETAEVFAVNVGDKDRIIAVKLEEGYALYRTAIEEKSPKSLGELLRAYGLAYMMYFSRFTQYKGKDTVGEYSLAKGGEFVRMLAEAECKEVWVGENYPASYDDRTNGIKLAVSCPETIIDNRMFLIDEKGVLMTNIFDVRYTCTVDKETAAKLISFAKENSFPAEAENTGYEKIIGGKITEIGDGYLKIDDSVLCGDESEGAVFTVPTDDLRIRRCIEFSPKPKVGDIVAVYFSGKIEADGTVREAYGLQIASLSEEGGMCIPE